MTEKAKAQVEQTLNLVGSAVQKSIKVSEELISGKDKPAETLIEAQEAAIQLDRSTTTEMKKKEEEAELKSSLEVIENGYGDPEKDCFIIISLVYAILPAQDARTKDKVSRTGWDPFVKVSFNTNDPNEPITMYTPILWRTSCIKPIWNAFKKFKLPTMKNMKKYPPKITFELWDKFFYETDHRNDELIGKFELLCSNRKIYNVKKKTVREVDLTGGSIDGCKLKIGISFDCISQLNLKKIQFAEREHALVNAVSERTLKWFDANIDLYLDLQQKESQGIRINDESFAKISPLPVGFNGIFYTEYENFIARFGSDTNENEKHRLTINLDKDTRVLYALYADNNDNLKCGGTDITNIVHLVWRYIYLKSYLLKGQDAEFNIYRSYYFDPISEKLYLSAVGLILQIILSVALTIHVYQNWESDIARNGFDPFTAVISVIVFGFLSLTTSKTISLYIEFYKYLYLGFDAPWYCVAADYMSNVVVTIWITILALFFLTQSDTYAELVLNSFALQFVYEIDDIINIFENDEDELIKTELQAFVRSRYQVPRQYSLHVWQFLPVLISPFTIFWSLWLGIKAFVIMFISCKHKRTRNKFSTGTYGKPHDFIQHPHIKHKYRFRKQRSKAWH